MSLSLNSSYSSSRDYSENLNQIQNLNFFDFMFIRTSQCILSESSCRRSVLAKLTTEQTCFRGEDEQRTSK
ncbi:hypothetical protein Bca4012_059087 [Brassica carinata]